MSRSISVPTVISKVLGAFPNRFQWLATVLVPLLVGGGAGLPVWHTLFGDELRQRTASVLQALPGDARTAFSQAPLLYAARE